MDEFNFIVVQMIMFSFEAKQDKVDTLKITLLWSKRKIFFM